MTYVPTIGHANPAIVELSHVLWKVFSELLMPLLAQGVPRKVTVIREQKWRLESCYRTNACLRKVIKFIDMLQ